MPLFSRKQSTVYLCVTIGLFLFCGILALLLPIDGPPSQDSDSSSSETSASAVPVSVFSPTDLALYSKIDIGIDVSASTLDGLPFVRITAKNNSTQHAFLGTITFHTEDQEDVLPPIHLEMLAPDSSITCFYSGLEPDFEDFQSLAKGNYYDYIRGDYPPPHTLIYIDGTLSGVQMNEANLTANRVAMTTGYLMMGEDGELPIAGSLGFLSQISLNLDEDKLIIDPGAVLWTGKIDLGSPVAVEIRTSEEDPEADAGGEKSDVSDAPDNSRAAA